MNHTDTEKLTFPEFPEPMSETSNRPLDSSRAMDELEPVIRYYLEHYDSPEKRWKTKNPEPFHI